MSESCHMVTTEEWYQSTGREYQALIIALRSRPLTVEELQRVGTIGYALLCPSGQPYYTAEKQAEFAALLSIQQSIQLAASRPDGS